MRKKSNKPGRRKRTNQEQKNRRTKYLNLMLIKLIKSIEERKRIMATAANKGA